MAVATIAPVKCELPRWSAPLWQPSRYKVMYGGRAAARSWTAARALLLLAIQRPMRILCARELQRSIQDSVHRLLCDQIDLLGLPGFERTHHEIRAANGSLFLFQGVRHNVTKVKSLEGIDIAWMEEAEAVSEDSWNVIIPTIRKPGSEIWITFNPDQETDATYRRFVTNQPPECWSIKVNSEDNPWLPEELRKEREYMHRVDPDGAAWVWGGECRQATDAQILRGKWVIDSFEPGAAWSGPYYGADWGFAQDPTVLVRCWVYGRTLYIEHESYHVGLELDDTVPTWIAEVPDCVRHIIRADSARPETISHVKRHGAPRTESAKKWSGSVEDGIAHLRQYENIVIHSRCKHAAQEARLWSYKVDDRSGDVLPVVVDRHNHVWDAVRYALGPLIRNRPEWRPL